MPIIPIPGLDALLDNPLVRIAFSVGIALFFFVLVFALFGSIPLPDQFESGLYFLLSELWKWDFVLPVELMLSFFSIWLTLEVMFGSILLIHWVWRTFTRKV